jgi:ATP-dependent exoDNAse (exonuclease V) beta subunit
MNKKVILIIGLILAIVMVSGCTNNDNNTTKEYNVTFSNAGVLETFNEEKALDAIKPNKDDAELGFNVTDHGSKTIKNITVYYNVYTDSSDNSVNGDLYFNKNNKWYLITWKDIKGNPNKAAIDKEIADKINSI